MPDGTHTLTVIAVQSDLLTTSANVSFVTDNQLSSALSTASSTIDSLGSSLSTAHGNIVTLQNDLSSANHSVTDLTYLAALAIALAIVGIALGRLRGQGGKAPLEILRAPAHLSR